MRELCLSNSPLWKYFSAALRYLYFENKFDQTLHMNGTFSCTIIFILWDKNTCSNGTVCSTILNFLTIHGDSPFNPSGLVACCFHGEYSILPLNQNPGESRIWIWFKLAWYRMIRWKEFCLENFASRQMWISHLATLLFLGTSL